MTSSKAHSYLAADNPGVAARFLGAAKATFEQLAEMPTIGRRWTSPRKRLGTVRVWRIHGFERWLVFYRVSGKGVEIMRVLHGARDLNAILETGT